MVGGPARAAVQAAQDQIAKATGRPVALAGGQVASLQQEVEAGQAFDLAVLTAPVIDDLTAKGHVQPGSKTILGEVHLGVGARGDVSKVDLSNADAAKKTLMGAKSIRRFYGAGLASVGTDTLLKGLGLTDALKDRFVASNAAQAATLAQGEYELFLNIVSEMGGARDWKFIGPVPSQLAAPVVVAAGIGAKADAAAAKALIDFLKSPAFATGAKDHGLVR
jgi:molybdate transport system substrate-binding protein